MKLVSFVGTMVIQSSAHAKRPFKGVTTFGIGYRMARLLIGTLTESSVGKRCITSNLLADDDSACSGAVFMALSYEKPISRVFFLFFVSFETLCLSSSLTEQHDIIPDGYNLARFVWISFFVFRDLCLYLYTSDWLVGNITQSILSTLNITDGTTYVGSTSSNGYTYETNIRYTSGLLSNTSVGINHNITVPADGRNAVDGLVAVLDVRISQSPPTSSCVSFFKITFR